MRLRVELDREEDGRHIAEVLDLPGVIVYGDSPEGALRAAEALALHVIADRIEHGELVLEGPLALAFDVLETSEAA